MTFCLAEYEFLQPEDIRAGGDAGSGGAGGAGGLGGAGGVGVTFQASSSLVNSGTTTLAGQLTKQGAGIWTIDRTLNASSVTISAGTLQVGNGGTTGSLGSVNITNNGTLAFSRSDNLTNSSTISGAGSLSKAGAGTLTLSGVNTYSGNNLVSAGTLNLSNSTGVALSNPGLVAVAGGATLLISQSNQANGAAVTLSAGTIARGSGAAGAMSFGIYEAAATPSALLTVNSFFAGNTLTFGTDLSGYITNSYTGTAFTSDFFNINSTSGGFTSDWNGSTFTAIPEPSTCAVAAGLAALFLGSAGRRLARATQGRRP